MTNKETNTKELIVWHEFDGPGDTSIQVLEELCKEYSERSGIQVTPEVMNISELIVRLNNVADSGEGPHMALVPADMASYGEKALYSEVTEELDNLMTGFGADTSLSMQSEGKKYGVPVLKGNHMVLYYNRDILSTPFASWEEIQNLGEELKSKGIVPVGADLREPYWFLTFFTGFGGWPMKDGQPDFLNDTMQETLEFVRKQMDQGFLENLNGSHGLLEQFIDGKVSAIICGEWIFNHLDQKMGAKLGVSHLPTIQGRPSVSMSSAIGLVYPNRSLESDMKEEIESFTKFMLSPESQLKWGTQVQRIPVNTEIRAQLVQTSAPNRGTLMSLMADSRTMPIEPLMNPVWRAIGEGLGDLVESDAETAYATMEEEYKRLFEEMKSETRAVNS